MTLLQKQRIDEMRRHGESYTKIAASLGLSENTIKSYCRRNLLKIDTCPQCGTAFQAYGNAKRKFCSRSCYGQASARRWRDE